MAVELQRRGGKAGSAGGEVPRGASGIEGEIEALRARAAALRAAGDDAAWLAVAERWAALAPQDARAFYHQGFAAKGLGRPEAAREAFAQAVRLAPTFSSARLELAVLLLAAGEVEATIDQLRVVVAQAPDNIQARVNLGVALRRAERPDEALQVYEAALALAPDHAELRQNLAELLIALDRPAQAEAHLRKLIELEPGNARVHAHLDVVLRRLERLDRSQLVGLLLTSDTSPAEVAARHRAWAQRLIAGMPPRLPHANSRDLGRRLRVGYLSTEFHDQSVAHFIGPVMAVARPGRGRSVRLCRCGRTRRGDRTLQGPCRSLARRGRARR